MTKKGKTGVFFTVCAAVAAIACIGGCNRENKATPAHEHSYNEIEWAQDDTGHWRAATCGHGMRKNYGRHTYDSAADADCNVCGRVRKIEEITDPAESNGKKPEGDEGKPDAEPAGFIISSETDGLLVEGVRTEYALSKTNRALNFNTLAYKVYLSESGEKGREVPQENYETRVYYGGKEIAEPQELTEDGRYAASVTLVDAYYEDGESVNGDGVTVRVKFKIDNGVEEINLIDGRTEQVSSGKDKMSGSWTYEAVRANGDTETVSGSKVELLPPDTETVGTRTTTVKYEGAESEIEYTVFPVPEIVNGGVDITARSELDKETCDEYAEISTGDFKVEYSAAAGYAYSVETTLVYDGITANSIKLKADGLSHSVTVRVKFIYNVEGDRILREYSREFKVTVRRKQEEINGPRILSGAEILEGADEVRIKKQSGYSENVNGADLEIRYRGSDDFGGIYYGLMINVGKAASVNIKLTVTDGAFAGFMQGEDLGDGQVVDGKTEMSFAFAQAGEYTMYVMLNNPSDTIIIHGVEIIY